MLPRLAACLFLAAGLHGCLAYEYEHEFWLKVDGSGTVYVTGRPELWVAFKGLGRADDPEGTATRVRGGRATHGGGGPYLFVAADFKDVGAPASTPPFPALALALQREHDR